ncbi:MAG: N-acetylmannosamine-6-phosphate 2-epimerase [Lachnospiraceae bacterium]
MDTAIQKKIDALKGQLIVSCQALPDEPMHSSFIMGRFALAAAQSGAKGIRANTKEDIAEIRKNVDLPIIGIVKRDYPDSGIYITPTMQEVEELLEVKPEIIAMDATDRLRPGGKTLKEFYGEVRRRCPDQLLMADCSTVEEALYADRLGFDFISTTLVGYTPESRGSRIEADDFRIIRQILEKAEHRVIAEGNIDTPQKLVRVTQLGVYATVVGSIITRPQVITKRFTDALKEAGLQQGESK